MKRQARIDRALRAQIAAGMRASTVPAGHVLLEDGPMADWLVKDGAACLDPSWSLDGSRYVRDGDRAKWQPVTSS